MLVNLSNHPFETWSLEQKDAAQLFGEVVNFSFPTVSPSASRAEISELAEKVVHDIMNNYGANLSAVHVMGEFTLCYSIISLFKMKNVMCIASTTVRDVVEKTDGTKISVFKFVQFREY